MTKVAADTTMSPLRRAVMTALVLAACLGACRTPTPLEPTYRDQSPVVQSLTAFPTTLAPGDSAIVVCTATDPDGDTLYFDWYSDCRLLMKGDVLGDGAIYNRPQSLVVYAGTCNRPPVDTGWVHCEVRDGRGGFAEAGTVRIVVHP